MHLLVIEDGGDHATALSAALTGFGHVVEIATTPAAGLAAIERRGADAAILIVGAPGMDAGDCLRLLRATGRTLPVLTLSATARPADIIGLLDAGADDHVTAATTTAEIDARLRAMGRARTWAVPSADGMGAGGIRIDPARFRAWCGDVSLDLTKLEFRVLTELVRHAGGFVTRPMLVESVWGYDVMPATNIVDAQIRTLRSKLAAAGAGNAIVTRRGVGYRLRD